VPPEAKRARWKIVTGYVAFGVVSFLLGIYLTFPYDVLKERILAEAGGQGAYVRVGSLGPGLFGITASNLEVSRKMEANEDKPSPALRIDSVAIRPSLFPLGVAVRAKLLHGVASAAVGLSGDKFRVAIDDLNLQDDNLKAFSGLSLAGHLSANLTLDMPMTPSTKSQPGEPDLAQASGTVSIDASGLQVNGGTIEMIDLPKVSLGELEGKIKFEKGAGTIETLKIKSDEVDVTVTGTPKLARRIDYLEPNALVKLKISPELSKRLGLIASGLAMLPADPQSPEYRTLRVQGFIGHPSSPDLRF